MNEEIHQYGGDQVLKLTYNGMCLEQRSKKEMVMELFSKLVKCFPPHHESKPLLLIRSRLQNPGKSTIKFNIIPRYAHHIRYCIQVHEMIHKKGEMEHQTTSLILRKAIISHQRIQEGEIQISTNNFSSVYIILTPSPYFIFIRFCGSYIPFMIESFPSSFTIS